MSDTSESTPESRTSGPKLVVGVDGSEQSVAALRQADRLARLLGARIEAVTTWSYPVAMSPYGMSTAPSFEDIARETLDDALKQAFGTDRPPLLTTVVQYGHPAQVLIERSAGAELLVLGSRGRGGFAGLLLGSVSAECAAHANCPVLVVR